MKNTLVTPTYAPDYQRCKAMLKSSEQWVTSVDEHLLIVDHNDLDLFRSLQNPRVRVICKEEVLPLGLYRIPLQKRWWLTNCSLPVRGWILQQIIKLAVAKQSHADAVIFADSDLMFINPLDLNNLWRHGQLRLYRTERRPHLYKNPRYRNWYGFSCRSFDLGEPEHQAGAYIVQLATMRPEMTAKLCDALEKKYAQPWYQALLNTWDFSEYVLYGCFVESYINQHGERHSGHYLTDKELCHSSWFYEINSEADIEHFVETSQLQHCAVHLQSNLKFDSAALGKALGHLY